VLDVGCGSGNASFAAAREGATVTGVDIAANAIAQAQARAATEGFAVRFEQGDAEALPYDDGSFDVVLSMFGVMFAPHPERAAAEMARVCRAGGQIALANWSPQGFIGLLYRAVRKYLPPSENPSPLLWGTEETVRKLLGPYSSDLRFSQHTFGLRFPFGPRQVVESFRDAFGPIRQAFAVLDEAGRAALGRDIEQLFAEHNQRHDEATEVRAEYLQVLGTRR
jgi:SAM-dependent methyltransferase